jgi:hypothetical protein
MEESKIVLSLFDRTGKMVKPWAENGYECYAVDIATEEDKTEEYGEGIIHYVSGDIHKYLPPRAEYEIVFAFPPCTDLAVSGARHFKDKGLNGLSSAIENVERARQICEWADSTYMIENPVSTLSTYWRIQTIRLIHTSTMDILTKTISIKRKRVFGRVMIFNCPIQFLVLHGMKESIKVWGVIQKNDLSHHKALLMLCLNLMGLMMIILLIR